MKNKLQVGVIGLGKFGFKFGKSLMSLGQEVLGIDSDEDNIKKSQHEFTQVFLADATNKQALEQIRVQDLEHILVSVGDSIAASAMIAMYLKELGVPKIWVKAIHRDHEKLLYKVGVDEVIIPEYMAAKQIASRIAIPGFIEHLQFDPSMAVREFSIDKWDGKTLRNIDLTNKYSIQVIAIKMKGENSYRYIPKADDLLNSGDTIVVIGPIVQLEKLLP